MSLEFIADIAEGCLVPPPYITQFLKRCGGKQCRIILGWGLKKRTLKQNSFYYGPVIKSVREWLLEKGYNFNAKEVHEFIVTHIWKLTQIIMIDDAPYERRLSSMQLSTTEWEDKIELVRQWAAERRFFVPYPNEKSQNDSPT